jgi:ferric-dicitrate binding protein FerR (iron transport regulator)
VLRAGATAWTALKPGDAVNLGDQVRTAAGSKLKLLFRDDSVVTLAPGSTLKVDQQTAGTAPVSSFSLLVGTIRALVTDRYGATGARFEVETPTAVAGVRGTGFITAYDESKEETTVIGLFDTTGVRSKMDPGGQREVRVGPGQMTTVGRGSYPVRPSATPEGTLRSFTGSTEVRGGKPGASGKGAKGGDPRLPKRAGQGALSPEGNVDQVVDQPGLKQKGGVKPPPPPVPGR